MVERCISCGAVIPDGQKTCGIFCLTDYAKQAGIAAAEKNGFEVTSTVTNWKAGETAKVIIHTKAKGE